MSFLHPRGEILAFNHKRACGFWLIAVSLVIFAAALIGGKQRINMTVFSLGYIAVFLSINANQSLQRRFSEGPSSPFQRKAGFYAVILLFVLMSLFGGPYFADENWRRIWLGAFLATALHFLPFYYVHGKSMLVLSLVSTVNVALGYAFPELPLVCTAYADAAIKLGFGVYLFCFSKPSKQN